MNTTQPALTCLRRAFPSAHIAWAVEEPSKDLLEDQPDLDETLIFPRRKLSRVLLHPSETGQARAALSAFMGSLKDAKFDLVIDFQATNNGNISSIKNSRLMPKCNEINYDWMELTSKERGLSPAA